MVVRMKIGCLLANNSLWSPNFLALFEPTDRPFHSHEVHNNLTVEGISMIEKGIK